MCLLLPRSFDVMVVVQGEELAQRGGVMALAEHRFLLGHDVEVHHCQIQFIEVQLLAQ